MQGPSLDNIQELVIQDSPLLKCLSADHFSGLTSLQALSVISSGLKFVSCDPLKDKNNALGQLENLTLAGNKLTELRSDDLSDLQRLRSLNLSHNEIRNIGPNYFAKFAKLQLLDLSNNKLTENIKPSVFKTLPRGIQYLDISSKSKHESAVCLHFGIS